MLKKWTLRAFGAIMISLAAATLGYVVGAQGSDPKPPVTPPAPKRTLKVNEIARVGEKIVTAEDLIARIWDFEQSLKPPDRNLEPALNYLVQVRLLELEAARIGCEIKKAEEDSVTNTQYESVKKQVGERFGGALTWDEWLKQQGMTDEGFRKYLAARSKIIILKRLVVNYYFDSNDSLECAHILVDKLKTADDVYTALGKGAKFEDLAVKHSMDVSSAQNGGKLPRHYKGDGLAKELDEKLWTMKDGEYSKPVQTAFGFHIVKRLAEIKGNKAAFFDRRGELLARADIADDDTSRSFGFHRWVRCVLARGEYTTERRLPGVDGKPNQP